MHDIHSRIALRIRGPHTPVDSDYRKPRRWIAAIRCDALQTYAIENQSRHWRASRELSRPFRAGIRVGGGYPLRARADEPGRYVDVESGHLSGGQLGEGDSRHGGVVGAESHRRYETSTPRRVGHFDDPPAQHASSPPRRRRPPAASIPSAAAPAGSWPRSRRPRLPGNWRRRRGPGSRSGRLGTSRAFCPPRA